MEHGRLPCPSPSISLPSVDSPQALQPPSPWKLVHNPYFPPYTGLLLPSSVPRNSPTSTSTSPYLTPFYSAPATPLTASSVSSDRSAQTIPDRSSRFSPSTSWPVVPPKENVSSLIGEAKGSWSRWWRQRGWRTTSEQLGYDLVPTLGKGAGSGDVGRKEVRKKETDWGTCMWRWVPTRKNTLVILFQINLVRVNGRWI